MTLDSILTGAAAVVLAAGSVLFFARLDDSEGAPKIDWPAVVGWAILSLALLQLIPSSLGRIVVPALAAMLVSAIRAKKKRA